MNACIDFKNYCKMRRSKRAKSAAEPDNKKAKTAKRAPAGDKMKGASSAEAKRATAGGKMKGASSAEAAVIADLRQVVANLESGDSPWANTFEAYVFVQNPDDLGKQGAAKVMVTRKRPWNGSADHALLQQLAGDDEDMGFCEPSPEMDSLRASGRFKTVSAAMPELVARGVKSGLVAKADQARLSELFSLWLKGARWDRCHMHGGYRPSHGSWVGMPWEAMNIQGKSALSRGLKATSPVLPVLERFEHPSEAVPDRVLPCFAKVWAKDEGPVADIEQAVQSAIAEARALST